MSIRNVDGSAAEAAMHSEPRGEEDRQWIGGGGMQSGHHAEVASGSVDTEPVHGIADGKAICDGGTRPEDSTPMSVKIAREGRPLADA